MVAANNQRLQPDFRPRRQILLPVPRVDTQSCQIMEEGRLRTTTPEALRRRFCSERPLRVAIEAGTHSPWVSRLLEECAHEVLVAKMLVNYDVCCVILWREERGHDRTPMVVCDPGFYSPLGDRLRIRVCTIPSTKPSSPSAGMSSPRKLRKNARW
jgi:hypothetical protein